MEVPPWGVELSCLAYADELHVSSQKLSFNFVLARHENP